MAGPGVSGAEAAGAGAMRPGAPWSARALRQWRSVLGAGLDDPRAALERALLDLILWAPIALGLGIGGYFALPFEPGVPLWAAAAAVALICGALWARGAGWLRFPAALIALIALGLLLASWRAHAVAAPVLPYRYYGPVEGRVVEIDRSGRDVLRLTLDRVVLARLAPEARPERVRVALYGAAAGAFEPGLRVMTTAHLSPPASPAAPGAWDFRRNAWFEQLGAVGYTRAPVVLVAPPDAGDWALAGHRLRMRLSAAMQAHIPGQAGAVAAALLTGDRSNISEATNATMRASNLYHIVSISGLHMSLLAGFVFAALRYGLAMLGPLALIWPIKKIAALVALAASTLYLWIAGAEVATERAWLMTSVMLIAVLIDRRAISLRTLALGALVVLLVWPESLTGPGFQMSFAATAALILVAGPWARLQGRLPVWLRPAVMLVVTSLVAGLATAPIAAANFGRMAHYGILANLLAVPMMGMVVMPAGVIAAVLAPLGLAAPALWAMGKGTEWVLAVSAWVAGLSGAQTVVVAPPAWVLPVLALGAIVAVLARGPVRLAGLAVLPVAALFWGQVERPALLIAPEGELVGLMTPAGRVLSKPSAAFVGDSWLEADGDGAVTQEAAQRSGFSGPKGARVAAWQGGQLVHLSGKGAVERLADHCTKGATVVLAARAPEGFVPACELWDQRRLRRTGAVAVGRDGTVTQAQAVTGARLWTGQR